MVAFVMSIWGSHGAGTGIPYYGGNLGQREHLVQELWGQSGSSCGFSSVGISSSSLN